MSELKKGVVRIRILWLLAALVTAFAGAFFLRSTAPGAGGAAGTAAPPAERRPGSNRTLVLATTTSVQDSGLLDAILKKWDADTGIFVRVHAVGSGKAVELGRLGEADLVLSHSPRIEEELLREGGAESRRPVASNEYLIVGPPADPARVKESRSAPDALRRIAQRKARFISRGDGSGTHRKEQELWKAASISPSGEWYESFNGGMGAVLKRAGEAGAYTLVDGATFAAYQPDVKLQPLHQGSAELANPYSVMVISPGRRHDGAVEEARRFAEFLTGEEGQSLIASFGVDSHGRALFRPAPRE